MNNKINKIKQKNAGFTLLELVVVVAVMGLISTMALDVYTDNSNQKRFELTKQRLAEIKFAIIGDPQMRVGSQAVLSGYYYDMNRLPVTLSELVYQCRTSSNVGIESPDKSTCEATSGNVWEDNWNGPYLINLQSDSGNLVFRDGWGNSSSTPDTNAGDFGWVVSPTGNNLFVQSLGLNRGSGSTSPGNQFENDYPASSINYIVTQAEVDNVKNLRALQLSGYCVNTTTKTIDSSKDQFSCSDTWVSVPTPSGYCVDKAAGTINSSIVTSATCTGTDEDWQSL